MTDAEREEKPRYSMNIWRSLKGLPRDVWVLSAATLINRAGTMVIPFLVLYLTSELGFSAPKAGLALGAYGVGSIIAAPISGRLTDRIGPLPIMRVSLVMTGVILLLMPLVRGFVAVLAVTVVWSIVSELFRPANLVMIADIVPAEKLKPAYALSRLAINLGMSIGPAAAGIIAAYSFRWIFIVDAVTTLVAGAVLIFTPFAAKHVRHEDKGEGKARSILDVLVLDDPRMVLFLSAVFLMGFVFFQIEGPLPLFLVKDLGLSPAFYGGLFTLNTVMIVFMEVPLNAATSHWPHRRALAIGAFLFAIGSGAFGFASGPLLVVLAMMVWTFGEMMLFPQASAYVAEIAPLSRRGQYMGAYSVAFSLAFAVAPWAGTTGYQLFGARFLWIGVFVIGVISGFMMLRVSVDNDASTERRAPLGGW
jgi:predicted MFS family arabinose efflux permease